MGLVLRFDAFANSDSCWLSSLRVLIFEYELILLGILPMGMSGSFSLCLQIQLHHPLFHSALPIWVYLDHIRYLILWILLCEVASP